MSIHIGLWQFIILALFVFEVVAAVSMHGKPRNPINAVETMANWGIYLWVIYMGGFFA